MDFGFDLPAIARMTRGETLVSAPIVTRNASHKLLLLQKRRIATFREKASCGISPQDCDYLATSKNCDLSALCESKGKCQIAIALRCHCIHHDAYRNMLARGQSRGQSSTRDTPALSDVKAATSMTSPEEISYFTFAPAF